MLSAWVAFVQAPSPPLPPAFDVTVFSLIGPRAFLLSAAWKTALLAALSHGLPPLFARAFPALDARTCGKAAGWVSALVHHAYVVLISLRCLRSEFTSGAVDIPAMLEGVTLTCAYLLNDTLATALPDALRGQYDYLLHHALSIAMTGSVIAYSPSRLLRLAPHLWLCEASAFGLGLSWACQKAGLHASLLCRAAEVLFLVTFLATRCLNLPLVVHAATANGDLQGPLVGVLWAIVALQFWWASKALARFVLPSAGSAKKAASDEE
jgi:hypothetical protein